MHYVGHFDEVIIWSRRRTQMGELLLFVTLLYMPKINLDIGHQNRHKMYTGFPFDIDQMVHMEDKQKHYKDFKAFVRRKNIAVDRIKAVFWLKMINPFQIPNSTDILNISTGEKASTLELITHKEMGMQIFC